MRRSTSPVFALSPAVPTRLKLNGHWHPYRGGRDGVMKPLPPLSSTSRHGGNGYRGPGAWKRHKKKHSAAREGPLDLGRILGNLGRHERQRSQQQQYGGNNRSKQGKTLALRGRLDSLSIALAPSHGVCDHVPPLATTSVCPDSGQSHQRQHGTNEVGHLDPSQTRPQQHQQHQPALCVLKVREDKSNFETRSGQQVPPANVTAKTADGALEHDCTPEQVESKRNNTGQQAVYVFPSSAINDRSASRDCRALSVDALRVPNGATKMSVDDRCTAEILGAQATLRVLHDEHKKIQDAMRRRRLELCLGDFGSTGRRSGKQPREKPIGYSRRKMSPRNNNLRKKPKNVGGAEGRVVQAAAAKHRCRSHPHPLLFMSEGDLQKVEQDQMRLEDVGVANLLKLEEARRRKQDFDTYYHLAVRYGPLPVDQFEQPTYPGSCYQSKVLDATRALQNWWWTVWPTLLRRRKAAALTIQSVFRGFLQRRRWYAIIRLRTLWGNTRIVAHSFTVWRSRVASFQRVKAFVDRFKARSNAKCLAALKCNAVERRTSREKLLRERLRRISDGLRLRVFEGWVRYTEASMAVERLRYRSLARPAFLGWRVVASADRIRCRLCWACATLAGRLLRWRQRSRYTRLRASCVKIQVVVRMKIASTRRRREVTASRTRRAEEIVQAHEDVRVRRLIDVEQQRLDRLQAAIEEGTPLTQKKATAFLGTAAGKTAIASRLAVAPTSSSESVAEVNRVVARRFVRREQALIRHDFNAVSPPPPLRCPRSDYCDATFVDRGHCLRHAADVHPNDAREVAELSAVIRDPSGLIVFERFIRGADFPSSSSGGDGGGGDLEVRSTPKEATGQPLPGYDGRGDADDGVPAARDALDLWKEIEDWRKVPSSSSGDRYRKLAASIMSSNKRPYLPDDVRAALSGEQSLRLFDKLGTAHKTASKKLMGGRHHIFKSEPPSSASSGNPTLVSVDPFTFEEASSRAVTFLGESKVGRAFLVSDAYRRYFEELHKPMRDAVEAEAADIAAAEIAEWAAEARRLRKAALDNKQGELIDSLAGHASELVLQGAVGATFLEGLVDDQASILAVMIIAERSTFAKVISAVWKEAVEEAAHLTAVELRGIDPRVTAALSEAACSSARSRIMDELIDQCTVDLTGPEGEMWPDARAMAAISDGLGYQVRSEIMSELIDAAVLELAVSGEAEALMSEADDARRRRRETGRGEGVRENEVEDATAEEYGDRSAGRHVMVSGDGGTLSQPGREAIPHDYETQSETAGVASLALKGAHKEQLSELSFEDGGRCSSEGRAGGEGWKEAVGLRLSDGVNGAGNNGMTEVEAAVLVQSALRRKAVYRKMKTKVARNFIRMYDPGEGAFYWYNNATMESSWDKPAIIDLFFKKPNAAKSVFDLGRKPTRPSIVSGFESST